MNQIVLGIIKRGDRVLVGRVKFAKLEAFGNIGYVFPGGRVEEGEAPEKAVARELREETGIEIISAKLIAQRVHPITNYEMLYYHCEVGPDARPDVSRVLRPDSDISIFLWEDANRIRDLMPTLNPDVAAYFSI